MVSRQFSTLRMIMMNRSLLAFAVLSLACAAALTQSPTGIKTIPTPTDPAAIPLNTGGVKNSVEPESWFDYYGNTVVRNVQRATLTPVLPDKDKATGAAVVVVPGGGFMYLAMGYEGFDEAHWLADHGIAAFVLKYRVLPTPASLDEFQKKLYQLVSTIYTPSGKRTLETPADAVADGEAALRLVRARAKEWGVDPARVGMMGFSGGAMITMSVTLKATKDTMPAFAAPIYGPMDAVTVPATAPPLFVAMADDDSIFGHRGYGLIESWDAAKKPVEFHLYEKGDHGFGMGHSGTTTEGWIENFYRWLDSNGFLKKQP